jgi:hypothetical protein
MSSCHICSEPYSLSGPLEPRILNCGHTICLKCLTFLITSSLKSCCPFCQSYLYETKINFPKNYALLDTIQRDQVCHEKGIPQDHLRDRYHFDMVEVERLIEQAQAVCRFEKSSLAEHREFSEQLQFVNHSTEDERKRMEPLRQQVRLQCQNSQRRLQKYECIVTLLGSIVSIKSTGLLKCFLCFDLDLGQKHSHLPRCGDHLSQPSESPVLSPISRRPDLSILLEQIR